MSHFTEVTQEMIDQSVPMPADWYFVKILSFSMELSKKGDSDNYILTGEVISNDKGDTRFAGKKIGPKMPWWGFNSKVFGMCRALWESLGVPFKPGTKLDWEALVGRTVCVFIEQGTMDGGSDIINKMTNKYRPIAA